MIHVIARHEAISKQDSPPAHGGNVKFRDCFVPRNDARVIGTIAIILILLILTSISFAQSPYTDSVYHPEIKSVEFYNTKKQASFPLITLGSGEKVMLAFDNLRGGSEEYYYTIEHCDALWNSSNISTIEYLQNYSDDKIINYTYSLGTFQKYTHYELTLPNENISPKIPGNYILKVYEDADQSKLVLTRRLYVLNPKIGISAEMIPSVDNSTRATNQKINFTLNYGNLPVQNPATNLRTMIMQNNRPETGILNTQPTYIRGTELIFSDVTQNDFPGGNEFRHFDTRTLKLNSERVLRLMHDTANTVIMLTDADQGQLPNYSFQYDLNGSFYVLNQDGTDPRTDADYAHLYFTFSSPKKPAEGTPYLVGRFNDFKLDEKSRMHYDAANNKFAIALHLKQGVYDYTYVWVDKASNKADDTALEGSHFETENDYQILVYYRPPGARWEELIGYRLLNTAKK
ncbi:type IX secretion system plug protein [Mucilaginibacter gotjawali]|uniref:Uncharacterized protein n=2 Tax=Mucilaginibacter gotjawali TaxID=1550579 RepID=A0A120MZ53_9SPHI|nr:DUF5103 domain-containing protein [Mucilaginibacter gotjawali]MBB3057531.1 hypothetical protein [Mucilaginibacter gotjawali]BAU55348.1 hypothetical protein MgSA37_03532 [Mucilaginibacter gotjawali]